MRAIFLDPSGSVRTVAVSLATIAALALLGLVLAYWTWGLLAPRPEPRARAAVQAEGQMQAAYALFGSARQGRDAVVAPGVAVRLLGVVAASDTRSGYAVLRLDAQRTVVVSEGADIEPGLRLAEVHADHVVLERSGQRETLSWPEQDKAAASGVPRARTARTY